jgi:hypothetical protein
MGKFGGMGKTPLHLLRPYNDLMKEKDFSPTGPKFHPEKARAKDLEDVLKRHTDVAEALLDLSLPSLVISQDIAQVRADVEGGMDLDEAVELEQRGLWAIFVAIFEDIPNTHGVGQEFLERFIEQKVRTDWYLCSYKDRMHEDGRVPSPLLVAATRERDKFELMRDELEKFIRSHQR